MSIAQNQMKALFTKAYITKYDELIPGPSFLKSFFTTTTSTAKEIHFEVRRGTEKLAVDVIRGTNGNRNTFNNGTEKAFIPPFYKEYFEATELDRYDVVFGQAETATNATIGYLANEVAYKYLQMREKIERAKELQAAQVFETGVVLLNSGDNIDYKRKADSLKDNSAAPWSTVGSDVEGQLITGAEFIRQEGKNGTPEFDIIMSGASWKNLKKTTYFTTMANFRQVQLLDIMKPESVPFGASFHGTISFGAYIGYVWTYDEGYETDAGVYTRYFPLKKVVMIPRMGTRFVMAHAGIPAIMGTAGRDGRFIGVQAGEYYRSDFIDEARTSHTFQLMSAPVAMPVTVDMIYTMTVEA